MSSKVFLYFLPFFIFLTILVVNTSPVTSKYVPSPNNQLKDGITSSHEFAFKNDKAEVQEIVINPNENHETLFVEPSQIVRRRIHRVPGYNRRRVVRFPGYRRRRVVRFPGHRRRRVVRLPGYRRRRIIG
ncbi:3063_t:CDS:1 [Ambispora gerdemannii]|uniref:3063_t:CDS:1 n=1 Tax=Ambispora gerdemannii TaxID=144530 RepID=A0A9N8VF86_9GLOM|nr:3063_t:CDS:1 [Ambispora gerdemannii]